jgi:hypothetical protein
MRSDLFRIVPVLLNQPEGQIDLPAPERTPVPLASEELFFEKFLPFRANDSSPSASSATTDVEATLLTLTCWPQLFELKPPFWRCLCKYQTWTGTS